MKVSTAIEALQAIKAKFGDIEITGGFLMDDTKPREIIVTDIDGEEIWPADPEDTENPREIDGVFITA